MERQSEKSICVYCGHKAGAKAEFLSAAHDIGAAIAQSGHRLIYGGGTSGMMGALSHGARNHAGKIMGVIPKHLLVREAKGHKQNEIIITDTMHERKKIMVMNADAFIMLPGGVGSLDEFFELITWRQLGLHKKHCMVLNLAGFWDPLIALLDQQIKYGFVPEQNRAFFSFYSDIGALCAKLARL